MRPDSSLRPPLMPLPPLRPRPRPVVSPQVRAVAGIAAALTAEFGAGA